MRDQKTTFLAVMRFAKTMVVKLKANNYKAHWSTVEQFYLLDRLEQELAELRGAMIDLMGFDGDEERGKAVMDECADVANFAMMISDNVRNESANTLASL